MSDDTKITSEIAQQIRDLVDREGWQAVREHPVLGPIWKDTVKHQNDMADTLG